jgi:hypothetical protein
MELVNKMLVGTAYTEYFVPLNTYFEELDVNDRDFGLQGFVMKTVFDAGVATSIGSPVGSTQASGGKTVTPDQSDAGGADILHRGGGAAQFAVAANVTNYGWVQCQGISRAILKVTGAIAANGLLIWAGDDDVDVFTDPGNEELIFGRALVAAASDQIAAGGVLFFG